MATLKIKYGIVGGALAGLAATLSGCLMSGPAGQDGPDGDGASILAAVDGIDPADRTRTGIGYELVCQSGTRIPGQVKPDGSAVRFAGDKVKDGDTCAMEIRLPEAEAAKLDWNWYGVADGKPVVGLLYGSDEGKVDKRALKLTLYKLYSPKDLNTFMAEVAVTFDFGADGAAMPPEATMTAALDCGTDSRPAGVFRKVSEKDGLLSFTLKVPDMKGKTCGKAVVMVSNVAAFEGATTEIVFPEPKKGETYKFPKDQATRITLKKLTPGDGIDVDTSNGGPCLRYEGHVCKDRREAALPFARNFVLAKVIGKKAEGQGEVVTFYAGAGEQGFRLLEAAKLTTADLNKAIKDLANPNPMKKFNFYTQDLPANPATAKFDYDYMSGRFFETYRAPMTDLADVTILHLEEVYVHGFHQVDAAALNARTEGVWMAHVKAVKAGAPEKQFVVGGSGRYFRSAEVPTLVENKPVFFHFPTLVSDMTGTVAGDRYKIYALKGGAMAPAACDAELSHYVAELSARNEDNLKPVSGYDPKMEACEVTRTAFDADLANAAWTVTPALYRWEWFKVTP